MTQISRGEATLSTPAGQESPEQLQPFLHDLLSTVRAPAVVLSSGTGDIRPGGVQGWFVSDVRPLSRFEVLVDRQPPESVDGRLVGADSARFTGVVRTLGDRIPDPTVLVERRRHLGADAWTETVTVTSHAQSPVDVVVETVLEADFAVMSEVKSGRGGAPVRASVSGPGLRWEDEAIGVLVVDASPAPSSLEPDRGLVRHHGHLERGESLELRFGLSWVPARPPEFTAVSQPAPWAVPDTSRLDPDGRRLITQGLRDLEALLLLDARGDGSDRFLAAGSPWFFTLFGRDSLWAARLMLPVSVDLALSTLRVLARRQGSSSVEDTEEEPGKIIHEVRAGDLVLDHMVLPPLYFGTVDATPLWLTLLHDAWRSGADPNAVAALMPTAVRCLRWVREAATATGFIRYAGRPGAGLTNQGWKDSVDSVQWSDGRLATAPIALCEVQGYAYEAAVGMADLVEAFSTAAGGETAAGCRKWAEELRGRFHDAFWVEDDQGRYPAMALDAEGRAVDAVASNMGHLLGTGILSPSEAETVAARLTGSDMDSGFGLRTLTARSPRFSELSYHGGAVWAHDTAISALGLAKEGHLDQARRLVEGLVAAAPAFGYRLPELYGGTTRTVEDPAPIPYPAACRPQAWSAAAPLVLLHPAFQSGAAGHSL